MQNDLISRKSIIEPLENHINKIDDEDIKEIYRGFIKYISEIPTAYDVEKVVKQLEKHESRIGKCSNCDSNGN